MRWKEFLFSLIHSAFSAVTALSLLVYGAYDCYENCRYDLANPAWPDDADAWQWDAIFWLGAATAIAWLVFLVVVFRFAPTFAAAVLAAQISFVVAGGAFVSASGQVGAAAVALVAAGIAAPGSALILLSARNSRVGGRGTRPGVETSADI